MKMFIIVLITTAGIVALGWFGYNKLAATSAENAIKLDTPEVAPAEAIAPTIPAPKVELPPVVTPVTPTPAAPQPTPTPITPTPIPEPVTRKPGTYTIADVAKHGSKSDCWTAVNGLVYNVTNYDKKHPGGSKEILRTCGIDSSGAFNGEYGGQKKPEQVLAGFKIGTLVK